MDFLRLQKALAFEAEAGFNDLQGNQYRFSEFLQIALGEPSPTIDRTDRQRLQTLAQKYSSYTDLAFADRQHLVAETRRAVYSIKQSVHQAQQELVKQELAKKSPAAESSQAVKPSTTKLKSSSGETSAKPGSGKIPELEQSVMYLAGVGPKSAEKLAKLGIITVRDLLYYYPREHIDYARQAKIRELKAGETATIVGTITACNCFTTVKNNKLTIFEVTIKDSSGKMKLSRFFMGSRFSGRGWQEQQKKMHPTGAAVAASGLVKETQYGLTLDNPQIEILEFDGEIDSDTIGRILPIYPLTEGVGADLVRRAMKSGLAAASRLAETLPEGLRSQYDLVDIQRAIAQIHFPDDRDSLDAARRRLVFDEFFYLQLGLLSRRYREQAKQTSVILQPEGSLITEFYDGLPFTLTKAQSRVVNEIQHDLTQAVPMNRLIQGDVGSGKTVVAVIALLAAIQAGYQGAFMAPTEVLAEQHYRKLVEWFSLLHLPVELLTGSTRVAKRRKIHSELLTGELPLLVGTHALIEDPVQFQKLGLIVIDEQHRFGVQQRARLQQKGDNPHVLTMTATPIPRTLALTLHGDLDVSQIDELPPGRKAIKTTVVSSKDRQATYDLMRREITDGRQIYVVLPLVEESEKLDLKSAVQAHADLQDNVFPDLKVGLLHGKMTSAAKDEAISAFRDRITQILVSTTVVEVGVDVPNASIMLIEHAERFGLSQLHQLRGRVGRGAAQSFCLLMTSSKSETARQRLKVLEQSQDGFFISEMDLRFRGPGAVLGTRQSGLPDFALASLVEDQEVLEIARDAAQKAIDKDPTLDRWAAMKAELDYRYTRLLGGAILT